MDLQNLLGLLAGILTTVSFLPQLTKVIKTKSAKDLSLGMLLIFCIGIILWIIYGILIKSLPIILTNSATLVLVLVLLSFKAKYN